MPNKRIFYASHAVQVVSNVATPRFGAAHAIAGAVVQGAQSVSINTNFSLEQIFQLGRLPVYDFVNNDPEIELTLNKVLDGYPLIWHLALGGDSESLVSGANTTCDIKLGVGRDIDDQVDNTLAAPDYTDILMTGMFINSVNYTFPTEGNLTEEVSFVGSHRTAVVAAALLTPGPLEPSPDTTVFRRQNVTLPGGATVWPTAVAGRKVSSISIAASLNREKMYALGAFAPFHRFVNFPLEVTTTFETIAVDANSDATLEVEVVDPTLCGAGLTRSKEPIVISICDSTPAVGVGPAYTYRFDLGSGNKLQSHSYSGGDTGGGNVNETFTYITYNDLIVLYNPGH
jgi:hypothetical protein